MDPSLGDASRESKETPLGPEIRIGEQLAFEVTKLVDRDDRDDDDSKEAL